MMRSQMTMIPALRGDSELSECESLRTMKSGLSENSPLQTTTSEMKRPSISEGSETSSVPERVSSEDGVPSALLVNSSTQQSQSEERRYNWREPFEPEPIVNQQTVMVAGVCLFLLASIWPPLLVVCAYIASKLIPYSFRTTDEATNRRKLFAQFIRECNSENVEDESMRLPAKWTPPPEIHLEHSYWTNSRGMLLHNVTMTPKDQPIRAVVFYCHGYTENVSFIKMMENQRLVKQGIAFCALEYEGHGLSDGPMGLINDWDQLVTDVSEYIGTSVVPRFGRDTPLFLMGESMGGAVAYCTRQRIKNLVRGVVFVAPMCKISENLLPPQPIIDILRYLIGPSGDGNTSLLGFLPIAPARQSLTPLMYKDPKKRILACRPPLNFGRNPRLATARELIAVTQYISSHLSDFDAPFLVVHGKADVVTDPQLSQALYDESQSRDKEIKLYDGMLHCLMCGETDENIDRVFGDVTRWVLDRSENTRAFAKKNE